MKTFMEIAERLNLFSGYSNIKGNIAWLYTNEDLAIIGVNSSCRKEAEKSLKSNAKKVFVGDLPELK